MRAHKFNYSEMSDDRCGAKLCKKFIKKNVAVRKKRRPLICYHHWTLSKNSIQNQKPQTGNP